MKKHWNTTIICVDSEETIIEEYKNILSNVSYSCHSEIKQVSHKVKTLFKHVTENDPEEEETPPINYRILTARTQEDALDIITKEKQQGNKIALGFFDIHLSDESGLDILEKSKEIMPDMLCCVVSPSTSKHEHALQNIFKTNIEWMCISKPFSKHQLIQTAFHMISSWNLRQEREEFEEDLSLIIELIHKIDHFDVLASTEDYEKVVLTNILDFLNIDRGLLVVNKSTGVSIEHTINLDMEELDINPVIRNTKEVFKTKKLVNHDDGFLFLPLIAKSMEAAIVIPFMELSWIKQNMLHIFLKLIAANAEQIISAKNNLAAEIQKREQNFTILQSIASTLCHHINNPLAIVKGFAEMTFSRTDNAKIKGNMLKITKASDNISGIVEILTTLNEADANNVIDTQIGIQIIDINHKVEAIRNLIDAKYEEKEKSL